jgi:hypothetical protein
MSAVVNKVISALDAHGCRPTRSGKGWAARCPAHEDKSPSLSVAEGSDGRALVFCHAGCSPDAIAQAISLDVADLFAKELAERRSRRSSRPSKAEPKATKNVVKAEFSKAASTWQAALPRSLGKPSTVWEYHGADGALVGIVARWDLPDGRKEIRPASLAPDGGWVAQAMPEPRPLYKLPALMSADRVIVVEGERCAAALASLGFTATTSSQGAKSADKADWSPLASKRVVIVPDHDEAGEGYARDVAQLVVEAGAADVRIVRLADHWLACPVGGDIADWLESRGDAAEPDNLCAAVEAIVAKAEPVDEGASDAEDDLAWTPFPVDALPEPLATFVSEAALAIGVDPSMVALPLLATVAGAIGNTRRLVVKSGWSIPPVLWTAVISESGSGKTPAFRAAAQFTEFAQTKAFIAHGAAMTEYDTAMANYELQLKDRAKRGGVAPEKPDKPAARRFIASDTTVEALVPILRDNPRGVVVAVDELAGWFTSHDAYRASGRGGVDRPKWLSMFDAGPVTCDRKTSGTIHVPSAAASITGGVQPAILQRLLTSDNVQSGLVGRFMFAMPPRRAMRWSEDTVSFSTMTEVEYLFGTLLDGLPVGDLAADGPRELDLDPDAKDEFRRFAEDIYKQQAAASGAAATMLSKLTALAGRLALIVHVVRQAGRESTLGNRVDPDSVRRGITIARWAGAEQQRVYRLLVAGGGVDEAADDASRLGRWLAGRDGGFASHREIRHGLARFRDDEHRVKAAETRLVAEGRAVRATVSTGGRPADGLRLVEAFGAGCGANAVA